jgi:hypothetical protein
MATVPAHRLSGVQRCVWRFRKHELDAILCSSSAEPAEGNLLPQLTGYAGE